MERDGSAESDKGWQRGEAAPPFRVHVMRPQLPLFMVFPTKTQKDGGVGFAPSRARRVGRARRKRKGGRRKRGRWKRKGLKGTRRVHLFMYMSSDDLS